MKYLDEYRDADLAQYYARQIAQITRKPWTIMEVQDGRTRAIIKFDSGRRAKGGFSTCEFPATEQAA